MRGTGSGYIKKIIPEKRDDICLTIGHLGQTCQFFSRLLGQLMIEFTTYVFETDQISHR